MTVLQVCAYSSEYKGNFIASLLCLEEILRRDGIQTIYAFSEEASERTWCRELQKRTDVYFLPEAKARIFPKTYQVFKSIYQEHDIAVVHTHFELYDIPATVMAPHNIKIIWHLHDPIKDNYNKAAFSRKLLYHLQYGACGRRATLLAVSQLHADFAVFLGFSEDKVHFVANGIDTEHIQDSFYLDKPERFLMFGWDVIRKGVDLVVEADRHLQKEEHEILVVGQKACNDFLKNNSTVHIRYCDPVDDVNELYKTSRAFLHVSRAEGLSYAMLEAVYAGLIVICSDIPENKVAEEFNGVVFVHADNADDIQHAMYDIICHKTGLTNEEHEKNRNIIEKRYSINSWAERIHSFYFNNEGTE